MAITATHQPAWTPEQLVSLTRYNLHVQYYLYIGVAVLLAFFGGINVLSRLLNRWSVRRYHSLHPSPRRVRRTGETSLACLPSAALASWRKATYRRGQLVQLLGLGSSAQLAAVATYAALNFGLAFSGAYGHPDYQAHHCARLCYANLPILVGLASKELGVVGWATGLSSATLNTLHRWAARIVFFLATYHLFGRAYTNVPQLNPSAPGMGYQGWGIAGYVFWSLMVFGSGRPIRDRWYSAFIFSHIGLFCISMIALSFHRPQVAAYLVAGCVIYILDRIVRFGSTVYYSIFKQVGRGQGPTATVEVISRDAIRIRFKTAMRWRPGAHSYLHAPLLGAGGHPFSIASTYLPITHRDYEAKPLAAEQVFVIRVHAGITRKLYETVLEKEGEEEEEDDISQLRPRKGQFASMPLFPAFLEGPYGHDPLAHHYESVVLFVGGSGVSFAVPILLDLVRRARNRDLGGSKPMVTSRVTWVWTIREEEQIEWVADSLRDAIYYAPRWLPRARGSPSVIDCTFERELTLRRVQIYVTGPSRGFSESNLNAVGFGGSTLPRTDTFISTSSYRSDISGVYPLPASNEDGYEEKEGERAAHSSSSTPFLGDAGHQPPTEVPLPSSSSFATSTSTYSTLHSSRPPSTSAPTTTAEHGHPSYLLPGDASSAPPARPLTPPFPDASSSHRNSTITSGTHLTHLPSSSIPIPLIHSRARIRDILAAVISATTYSGSVLCGTCGPSALTDEVGNACADAIRPRKVWEGEHRVNVTLHAETFGW
ncbi:hypothetical protein BCR35DRAFT_336414 [Leucosporidium creatinivorum]|uniref:FAD-binding FR-type domain-containing protein n=1 Tax=Leucosporidium creatinivorum TaxID=106004 RepID=A0A1Y2C4J7_9BASI|nr:hypothetical protein BCR35DRAFT_336414 [Leucosporidium creatinivorum]